MTESESRFPSFGCVWLPTLFSMPSASKWESSIHFMGMAGCPCLLPCPLQPSRRPDPSPCGVAGSSSLLPCHVLLAASPGLLFFCHPFWFFDTRCPFVCRLLCAWLQRGVVLLPVVVLPCPFRLVSPCCCPCVHLPFGFGVCWLLVQVARWHLAWVRCVLVEESLFLGFNGARLRLPPIPFPPVTCALCLVPLVYRPEVPLVCHCSSLSLIASLISSMVMPIFPAALRCCMTSTSLASVIGFSLQHHLGVELRPVL